MKENQEIIVRRANYSDLHELIKFFIKAYGNTTIFKNEQFLEHYFYPTFSNEESIGNCLIGLNSDREIVSHYGGLNYNLKINNKIISMIWGVSAYTLPEWRGKGYNSKIIDFIFQNNEINGVIGFTEDTASFYQKTGYNLFEFERFTRYIMILDLKKTLEIVNFIQQDYSLFSKQKLYRAQPKLKIDFGEVVELTKENINRYTLNLEEDLTEIATTHRSLKFLNWRFFDNPYIKYKIFGVLLNQSIVSYIVLREEQLKPYNYKVSRIIDLYGKKEGIGRLIEKTFHESISKKHIYIDFSMFGNIYDDELVSSQFIKLENEDFSILPQVTSPIENRPNREFLGIQSKSFRKEIENLTKSSVYFTRMDSDRDRLVKISQINQV
ncbi:MAG: hypothetical protein A2041_09605 [Bacteroidetes bacterium GWA2_31_9b]|nr:MAG: hypothetical protein A2041_09605 [Bacteroidetes bacterium GWA2_31_9b]